VEVGDLSRRKNKLDKAVVGLFKTMTMASIAGKEALKSYWTSSAPNTCHCR
jgi:hypothetical protein